MESANTIINRIHELYCAKGLKEEYTNILGFKSSKPVQSLEEIGRDELFNFKLQGSCAAFGHNGIITRPSKKANVLIIGNHSAGKSSFINWYIGERIQSTGIAIETSHFTMVTHGEKAIELSTEGTLSMYPFLREIMSRSDKTTYGTFFANLNTKISSKKERKFDKIDFIDTPGLTDGNVRYNCDIIEMMKWVSEFVDLILVFLDPVGQALCMKTMEMIEFLNSKYSRKLKICLSKVDQIENEEDFAKLNLQIYSEISARTQAMNIEIIPFSITKDFNKPTNKIQAVIDAVENTAKFKSLRNIEILTNDCYFIQNHVERLKAFNTSTSNNYQILRILQLLFIFMLFTLTLTFFQEPDFILAYIDFKPALILWSLLLILLFCIHKFQPKLLTPTQLAKLEQWSAYIAKALAETEQLTSSYFNNSI